jgi:hypothetical protein
LPNLILGLLLLAGGLVGLGIGVLIGLGLRMFFGL